jgi:hypothetical protein
LLEWHLAQRSPEHFLAVILMSVVKHDGRARSFRGGVYAIKQYRLRIAGGGGVETTVDQTLMRG